MAPELFVSESRPSKATDIYAFGIVIYEVRHATFSGEPVLKNYSRGFSPINDHSPVVPAYLR
jgi:serine/threonine protein kinase